MEISRFLNSSLKNHYFNPFSPTDQDNAFANSVDPDEMAFNDLLYQNLHCLSFCFDF